MSGSNSPTAPPEPTQIVTYDGNYGTSVQPAQPLYTQPLTFPVKLIRPRGRLQSSKDVRPLWEAENALQTVMEETIPEEDPESMVSPPPQTSEEALPSGLTRADSESPPSPKPSPPLSLSEVLIPIEDVQNDGAQTEKIQETVIPIPEEAPDILQPVPALSLPQIPVANLITVTEGDRRPLRSIPPPMMEVSDEADLPKNIGHFLLESCLTGSWTSVENQIKILDRAFRDDGKREDILIAASTSDSETGFTPLMLCAKENKTNEVTLLHKFGANMNAVSKVGETALHMAASHAKDEMIRLLVTFGADATLADGEKNQLPLHIACLRRVMGWPIVQYLLPFSGKEGRLVEDKDGFLPIWCAALEPNIHVMKELLTDLAPEQLSYQNKQQNGDTLMHFVLRRKDTESLKALIDAGAPVDMQNFDGQTLLHIATNTHNDIALTILHDHKANPEIADRFDRTPLHLAVENGSTTVVEVLTEKFKGSIMARTADGSTLAHLAALTGHPEATLALLRRGVPLNMPNKAGALALHAAARAGHAKVIGILIENGSPVDAKTNDNYTPLHLAVEFGKPHVTEALLGYGASVDIKGGSAEETALHIAARVPSGELCAEMLIKSGADVNALMQNGETALHVATRYGSLRMVQILLQEGAETSAVSKSGETPLHVAVRNCNYYVAKELLEHAASRKSKTEAASMVNAQNMEGETAMHYAAEIAPDMTHFDHEDVKIVQLLLDFSAEIGVQTKMSSETPLHYCARCGNIEILNAVVKYLGPARFQLAVNKQAKNGWSPLLTASEHGHEEIVKQLLRNNARVDVFDEQGKAALHIAAENGHLDIVDYLLRHKAFVNAKSKLGVTPLHLAATKGWTEIVQVLVEKYDAATDALSLAKRTPLHMAAQYGKLDICDALLRMKADPNAKDQKGQTPLHLAAENDHSGIVELFLKAQADTNPMSMVDENGYTVAHIAAKNGSAAVIQLLINFNKEQAISAKTKTDESTALHLAAAGGHSEVVKILIEGGASPVEENKDGMTPLHLAAKFGFLSVLEVLKDLVSLKVCSVKTGFTALHLAAFYGQVDFARELLTSVSATVLSEQPTVHNSIVREIGAEPGLTPLHLACHSGQENLVRLLLNYPGVQVDAAAESTGMIPLHMAAMQGHIPIVGLLLSKSSAQLDIRDKKGRNALMLAASNGHEEMTGLLIGQGADVAAIDNNTWTALHHTSRAGHLKVVKILIEAGASPTSATKEGKIPLCFAAAAQKNDVLTYLILKDHDCFELLQDKAFMFDLMNCGKIFHQKALEDFITTSPSPVEIALKLSRFYKDQSLREKELERDLTLASKFCETLGNDLLTISCNRFNPALVLRAVDQYDKSLMDILIEGSHKEVVSDPAVQRYLTDVWYGNEEWSDMKSSSLFLSFLLCPPVWFVFSLPLGHKYNYVPFMKLLCHIVSHLFFIVALILVFMSPFEKLYDRHDAFPRWAEWILIAWLLGKFVDELFTAEERKGLGWIRVLVLIFCGLAIIMHIVAFPLDPPAETIVLYVRNQLFASACLFACIQIVNYLSFHYMFGPMGIIIRDLVKDLMRFLVVLALFMIGFSFSHSALFLDTEDSPTFEGHHYNKTAPLLDLYYDPLDSFQYLYFALFGLVDPTKIPVPAHSPAFSPTLIKILIMIYLMVTMVVLINLLIAMLSDTYQRIQARSDLEWKYGRAKLIMNMDKSAVSPPPINVVTVLGSYLFDRTTVCIARIRRKGDTDSTEELTPGKLSREGSKILRWRRSLGSNTEGGAAQNFRKIPIKKLVDVVDWDSIVSAYRGGSATDYEMEGGGMSLGVENET